MPVVAGVAALDIVVVALVAAILGFALYPLFRPLLSAALGGIPYAGPWIAQHVEELLASALGAARLGADVAAGPLADLLRTLLAVTDTLTRYITGTLDNVFNLSWRIVTRYLPALEQRAAARADQVAQIAIDHADQEFAQAVQRMDQEFAQAIQHADQVAAAAIQHADQDVQIAIQHADQAAAAAAAYAGQLGQQLEAQAGATAAAQADYAQQLAQGVLGYVQAAVHDLELGLEQVGARAGDYARALERAAVDHADAAAAAVAVAAAAATAGVEARVKDIEDSPCQRFCGPLGDLGGLLQGLEEAGLQALLLAVLAEVESDPQGVQRVLAQDFAPILQDALGALG